MLRTDHCKVCVCAPVCVSGLAIICLCVCACRCFCAYLCMCACRYMCAHVWVCLITPRTTIPAKSNNYLYSHVEEVSVCTAWSLQVTELSAVPDRFRSKDKLIIENQTKFTINQKIWKLCFKCLLVSWLLILQHAKHICRMNLLKQFDTLLYCAVLANHKIMQLFNMYWDVGTVHTGFGPFQVF